MAIEQEIGTSASDKLRKEKSGVLLLIDGMDEVPEEDEEKRKIIGNLKHSIEKEWKLNGVVITTRTGGEWLIIPDAGIQELMIRSVSLTKLIAFVVETCSQINMPTRMAEDLRKSDLFRQLPQNPIAAILLSKVIREEGKELPSGLTEIYSKATELMLGRWDQQKGIVQEKEYLVVRYVMERIAKKMIDNNMWEVSKDWITAEFAKYIDERKLNISKEKVTQQALKRTGVLVEDNRNGMVEFKHASIMEFLYASGWEPNEEERIQKMYARGWMEIYFFYIGLKRDGENLLQEALGVALAKKDEKLDRTIRKVMYAPSYIMAGWTAPYRIVEENLGELLIKGASVFLNLRDETTEPVVENLTEVQLLYIIQAMIREQYSYNHFKEAIDYAVLNILDWQQGSGNQEAGYYALLLAALIGNDIEEEEPLRILIEETRIHRLPAALALGLNLEGQTDSSTTERFKKLFKTHKRRLTKAINRDASLRGYIRNQALVPLKVVRNRKNRKDPGP